MQTLFTPTQLADPATATSEAIIRKCVHCGFCTATCPTYVLLGDELDSPRGRIYLIKDMLEGDRDPTPEIVKHVDRCLSCLSCMTTCPSGVNYMHLVDHARSYIETRYRRPLADRLLRWLLAAVLPHPRRFRAALALARAAHGLAPLLDRLTALRPYAAMLRLVPATRRREVQAPVEAVATKGRVILLQGCVEPTLRPAYQAATERLLARLGYGIVRAPGEGCCGALSHHLGRDADGLAAARRNVDAWIAAINRETIEAILVTASGCGTMMKDYGHLLRNDPAYADRAARVSAMVRDVSEFLSNADMPAGMDRGLTVAYQAACSLQHGQKVDDAPRRLLVHAGYRVRTPIEAHLCCGSAGTYNILQPDIAGRLAERKIANIERLRPEIIATGNVGCATHLARVTSLPIVHVVELLDWATGGPQPEAIAQTSVQET